MTTAHFNFESFAKRVFVDGEYPLSNPKATAWFYRHCSEADLALVLMQLLEYWRQTLDHSWNHENHEINSKAKLRANLEAHQGNIVSLAMQVQNWMEHRVDESRKLQKKEVSEKSKGVSIE